MNILRLDINGLLDCLSSWAGGQELYGPVKDGWRRISRDGLEAVVSIPPGAPKAPIKTFFLAQPETLFTFSARHGDDDAWIPTPPKEAPNRRVLFGVRPCDARSIALNSMPYRDDPYYQARMDKTAVVGLSCNETCSTCFCKSVGGSPYGTEGLDILLTKADGGFIAEVLTSKGEGLLEKGTGTPAGDGDMARLKALRDAAQAGTSDTQALSASFKAKNLMQLYNARLWQGLSEPCLNCGACTFLCPTCYCFDIQDEVVRQAGRRIRYWDSCMFPLFTLHASGHNPRGEKIKRVRNRFMHKLKYFTERFGALSCVGCGRCIRECPVNIDIREVIRDLLSVE
ncbi:MAG: 4Fe-4S dicluster domain-containing protein [Desulfobacteraceae bacterium]|nr:4Fe-4S dicluster domain-containing protein [Desulfobacteraceae bacterium]